METLYIEGFSAFAGAFFAFLFLRLAEFLTKVYTRQVKHYNSLINLQTQLNELGGIIYDNLYLIEPFRNTILSGNIYFSKLRVLPFDRTHYENLHDISLINDLFTFNYQLRKLNDDIENITDGYMDIKNALIQHHISKEDYIVNAEITSDMLVLLEIFLNDVLERSTHLLAKVQLMSKKDVPLGTRLARLFIHTSGSRIKEKSISERVHLLKEEIEQTKKQSRKEIDEALSRYKKSN